MNPGKKKCIMLLSGGSDSITLFAKILEDGWTVLPVSIDYNQKHRIELESAKQIVNHYAMKYPERVLIHKILQLDLRQIGGSALTDENWLVPHNMVSQIKTVVPFRNLLMSTMALSYGSTLDITDLFITPVKEDFKAYRDCRVPFYNSLMKTLRAGYTYNKPFKVHTPFINKWKKEILKWGLQHDVPYKLSFSCYNGVVQGGGCQKCPACLERSAAFKSNNTVDPLIAYSRSQTSVPNIN